ncbi:LCP family protein [Streptantibioticus silvisoli]|uniref:LCP family protein n=1 Tax=Streptantibioticus silvisoli TaxID=2705255 RepID=A0ABT6W7F8_9ACTN|nr:LCP family protein [Streptantibioticus silvisoli]MDI5966673.1 LCP family protein [Streptantibioticus silvisoli]
MTAGNSGGRRPPVRDAGTRQRSAARLVGRQAVRRVVAELTTADTGDRTAGDPARGRAGSRRRPREGARRRGFVLALAASLAVLLVAAVGAVWFRLDGDITAFSAGGESKNRPPANQAGENVLLLGSDSRAGSNRDFAGGTGDIGRSDTAILLHVFADHRHALGVSVPRDSLVTIPPCLLPNGSWSPTQYDTPFNAAFSMGDTVKGNPACTQNTVEQLTGLRVDHTIVVDFAGFAAMTDAVHGVQVCVPSAIHQGDIDPNLGFPGPLVFPKGLQTVSGAKALDYVRLRHGIGDGSDIGRTQRQQAFIGGMIKKVRGDGFDVSTLLPLADAAAKSLTVDPGLDSAGKLLSFAQSLKGISLSDIQFVTAPWRYAGEKIDLVHPDVDALWAALKADRTLSGENASGRGASPSSAASPVPSSATPVDGGGMPVAVYNGTTVPGLAARAAALLQSDAFTVTGTGTALSQAHTTTLVEYGRAHRSTAENVVRLFPGARLVPTPAVAGVDLVLGTDFTSPVPTATALPSTDAANARTADEDPCADLSYGAGG